MAETYAVDWGAFNETLTQLSTVQSEINELNQQFGSGNTQALTGWISDVKDLFDQHKLNWNQTVADMQTQAAAAQKAADQCREEYLQARTFGMKTWGG
jgi:ABC-type transporter Mla subunit MlaD